MSCEDLGARVERLEAWAEAVMRTLAGIGLEDILCELDEARGAYDSETASSPRPGDSRAAIGRSRVSG
jgi:hypothetical protein